MANAAPKPPDGKPGKPQPPAQPQTSRTISKKVFTDFASI